MAKAETGQEETEFFISEQAWENWANQSVYGVARQPLPWEEFKEVVGQCDGSLLYEKGGSIPAVLQNAGDTYRSITMECVDSKTGDVSGDSVRVLLEKVDGNWRIVGQGNRN
ncbi:MAG: hypothetical protein LRY73_16050 [Bacillus sp. (in: Bacteria)]|nr:hypothetical protein [Bacillus sp. (in: firmicutes)]